VMNTDAVAIKKDKEGLWRQTRLFLVAGMSINSLLMMSGGRILKIPIPLTMTSENKTQSKRWLRK